jgi:hypothetical protein
MAGSGTLIPASDYNNIQTKVAGILGVGSGQSGYAQVLTSAQVGATDPIRASHWSTLRYDLIRARFHQTGVDPSSSLQDIVAGASASFTGYISGTTLTISSGISGTVQRGMALYTTTGAISTGTVIQSGSSLTWTVNNSQTVGSAGSPVTSTAYLVVTDLMLTEFDTMANDIVTNKFVIASNQLSANEPFSTNTKTIAWNGTQTNEVTVTFASGAGYTAADACRAYFNAGGDFRFTASRSGGTTVGGAAAKNGIWTTMLTDSGTVTFNYNNTVRSNQGTAFAIGFYNLTNSYQTIFDKSAPAGAYSENRYIIQARCNVANNSSGGASVIYFSIQFQDNDPGGDSTGNFGPPPYGPGIDESPDGTLVSQITLGRPSGVNVSCPAPTPTLTTTWT